MTRIIIVDWHEELVGLIADKVHRVTTYEEVHRPSEVMGRTIGNGLFSGVASREERLVGILKLQRLMGS